MDIITNKDVFSAENQARLGRSADKRRGGGSRGKKPALPMSIRKIPTTTTPLPTNQEKGDQTTRTAQTAPNSPAPSKTVFYQAARPKPKQSGFAASSSSQTRSFPARPHQNGVLAARPRPQSLPTSPDRLAISAPAQRASSLPSPQGVQATPAPIPRNNRPDLKVRIIPLGGLEEIGKNMTAFEYGNDIIIVDMGLLFPDSDMLGVDYIIPDVTYLQERKEKIRGAIITHGHLDHIGAVPYLVEKLGFPALYGTPITLGMIKNRLEEFNLIGRNKLVTIEPDKDVLQLGAFRIRPFRLIHSVPGAIGLEIETPNGRIVYATDWKFDYTPASGEPIDYRTLASIGLRGVDLLFSDSTNADRPGHSISEKTVELSIIQGVSEAKGRVVMACFASDLNRIQMAVNAAAASGRKVLAVGRSILNNLTMAIELKAFNLPPNILISDKEVSRFDDNKLLILATGAQGEERAALSRMAKGEHRTVKIKKGDTIIISASPIPGNERSVGNVMELLYKAGATVIYNKTHDVHTSGHAYQEDLKLMAALMRPRWFIPLHGERARRILHGKLAAEVGINNNNILIANNGSVLELDHTGNVVITDENVPAGYVIVDGLGVGDVGEVVLRDRQSMAQEGIFVIIAVYDGKRQQFLTSPDIISRGFIYMRENERFVNDIRQDIKEFLIKGTKDSNVDLGQLRAELRDYVSKLLYTKTEREPIVIPVIIEV